MKRKCPKCGIEKPLTTEFFHRGKDIKEGFKSSCKVCRNADKKKWRDANKERVNSQAKEYHIENRENRLIYAKEYHQKNKTQRLSYGKEWAKNNPDKVKAKEERYRVKHRDEINRRNRERYKLPDYQEWLKTYYADPVNKRKKLEYWREYSKRKEVREKILERKRAIRNSPEGKLKIKAYKQSERGRLSNKRHKHKRRSIERETIATLSLQQWKNCLDYFKTSCAYCGKESDSLTQDHFVPVSKGGEYTVKNIIPSCGSCNFSKSDKDFFEWYPHHQSFSKTREKKILKYLDIKDNTQQIAMF